jgi:hypothetical protein
MPDEVADAVDSEEDAELTWWTKKRQCERCGESATVMVALVNITTRRERLYCWWECIAPLEDEDGADEDLWITTVCNG